MTQTTTTQVLYPVLRYADAPAAIRWLQEAFGLAEQAVYPNPDGTIAHAQLSLDGGIIMLGSARSDRPVTGGSIYAYVADPDAHHARAKAAGATITMDPHDTEYGSREYSAHDSEGHSWSFGTYRP